MSRIRVLVVDDSVVVRKALTDSLSRDAAVEVVGTAANGSICLQKIPQVNPDIVVLDVEMPEMDGIEAVRRIREGWPRLPVIMCSSLTEHGADITLRALANGASDYVAKPSRLNDNQIDALGTFKADLLAKVKALGQPYSPPSPSPSPVARPVPLAAPDPQPFRHVVRGPVSALAIGCSTGGPNALAILFDGFPRDLPVPIFIVQHMPPLFTKMLADRLTASSGLSVCEAKHGDLVEPGCAYLAPGDFHMTVVRDGGRARIALNQETQENSCRPAVDVLFRSVAKLYGAGVLAAVMTGMGQDGTRGARDIVDAGGAVIVQDAASCVVPSMPGAVSTAGLADGVFPLDRLAQELVFRIRRVQSGHATSKPPPRRMEA